VALGSYAETSDAARQVVVLVLVLKKVSFTSLL